MYKHFKEFYKYEFGCKGKIDRIYIEGEEMRIKEFEGLKKRHSRSVDIVKSV